MNSNTHLQKYKIKIEEKKMDPAKSKQRKITDYFPRLPDKVSRTRSFLLKFKNTLTEGTQTEGVYEIEPLSKEKEGLKFLVYRFYNYE